VPRGGAVLLSDLVGRLDRLEVRCQCCNRYGRMRLAKLIEEHGADTGMPDLVVRLAGEHAPSRPTVRGVYP
jgi:hypothetical protein